jgi:hypothetical protein
MSQKKRRNLNKSNQALRIPPKTTLSCKDNKKAIPRKSMVIAKKKNKNGKGTKKIEYKRN